MAMRNGPAETSGSDPHTTTLYPCAPEAIGLGRTPRRGTQVERNGVRQGQHRDGVHGGTIAACGNISAIYGDLATALRAADIPTIAV